MPSCLPLPFLLLGARKLLEIEPDKANLPKSYIVDRAIDDAAFILERIDKRWLAGKPSL